MTTPRFLTWFVVFDVKLSTVQFIHQSSSLSINTKRGEAVERGQWREEELWDGSADNEAVMFGLCGAETTVCQNASSQARLKDVTDWTKNGPSVIKFQICFGGDGYQSSWFLSGLLIPVLTVDQGPTIKKTGLQVFADLIVGGLLAEEFSLLCHTTPFHFAPLETFFLNLFLLAGTLHDALRSFFTSVEIY